MDKEVRQFRKAAKDQGWTIEETTDGQFLVPFDFPAHEKVLIHNTNSDKRWVANTVAQLRRSGLIWPAPAKAVLKRMRQERTNEQEEGR